MEIKLGPERFRFETYIRWVNKAAGWFEQLTPTQRRYSICVDAKGRICNTGREFKIAHDEGAFPIVVYVTREDVE